MSTATFSEDVPFLDKEEQDVQVRAPLDSEIRAERNWRLVVVMILTMILSSTLSITVQRSIIGRSSISRDTALLGLHVPYLGNIIKNFTFAPIFVRTPSEESEQAWSDLIPKGRGFVSLKKMEAAGPIPPAIRELDAENKGQFSVSVFHQLHCLYMLRKSYYAATTNHDHDVEHVKHCFEYLRQSIMCAVDTSLEPFKWEIHGVDGFGHGRRCRNYEGVFQWAEKFRASDVDGI